MLSILESAKFIAITGAGGKTTLMFSLARKLAEAGKKVISTTSTHIFVPTSEQSPLTIITAMDANLSKAGHALAKLHHVTIGRDTDPTSGKLIGIDEETILKLGDLADCTIIEADGAAGRPVKAPEAWEPVIPTFVDTVIFVIGLDALGQRANEKTVFRVDRFSEITGLARDAVINPEALANLACHPLGGMKGVPTEAKFIILLNKIDKLSGPIDLEMLGLAFHRKSLSQRKPMVIAASMFTGAFMIIKL